ncbi:hypothetical protein BHE74_00032800 [Ensete ventricosum]|nr:hypothetical protein BHE74_00032800 [Ensete ventricosum]
MQPRLSEVTLACVFSRRQRFLSLPSSLTLFVATSTAEATSRVFLYHRPTAASTTILSFRYCPMPLLLSAASATTAVVVRSVATTVLD